MGQWEIKVFTVPQFHYPYKMDTLALVLNGAMILNFMVRHPWFFFGTILFLIIVALIPLVTSRYQDYVAKHESPLPPEEGTKVLSTKKLSEYVKTYNLQETDYDIIEYSRYRGYVRIITHLPIDEMMTKDELIELMEKTIAGSFETISFPQGEAFDGISLENFTKNEFVYQLDNVNNYLKEKTLREYMSSMEINKNPFTNVAIKTITKYKYI